MLLRNPIRLKNKYDLLWDQKSPEGYLKIAAIINKYLDQTASWNTSYNPQFYEDEELPLSEMMRHILLAYKWGLKTLYYNNTYDNSGDETINDAVETIVEVMEDQEECTSCVI